MTKLYHVKGYDWEANERRRYAVTAATDEEAVRKVKDYDRALSELCVMYLCRTPDELFFEL